jgi:hypothetical protein
MKECQPVKEKKMSKLFEAMNENTTRTENGMPTLESSMDSCVDLFFKLGGSRGKFKMLEPLLASAAAYDLDLAVRILLWGRDVRHGAGERQIFKDGIRFLFDKNFIDEAEGNRICSCVPELGRWDDVLAFFHTPSEQFALFMINKAFGDEKTKGLVAKWMPREKNDPQSARLIRDYMHLSPKAYRKLLVRNTEVVETKMCANEWMDINYEHVPSVASARYQKAFGRHDQIGYGKYIASLEKGEAKINAGAVYPYDITKSVERGNTKVADEQWKALPDFLEGDNSNTLVVADVSGSMDDPVGGNKNITALHVCISLAIYLSERNHGIFKDQFVTFSNRPSIQTLKGTLTQRVNQLRRAHWEMNTDLQAVFELILLSAQRNRIGQEDMPSRIIILSDMQFDQCMRNSDNRAMQMINEMYKDAGYTRPDVIFWNLRSSNGVPVKFNESGTALISGFSPSIMKSVLKRGELNPIMIMERTVKVDRYNW